MLVEQFGSFDICLHNLWSFPTPSSWDKAFVELNWVCSWTLEWILLAEIQNKVTGKLESKTYCLFIIQVHYPKTEHLIVFHAAIRYAY